MQTFIYSATHVGTVYNYNNNNDDDDNDSDNDNDNNNNVHILMVFRKRACFLLNV